MIDNIQVNYDAEVDKLYAEIEQLSMPENIRKTAIARNTKVILNVLYAVVVFVLLVILLFVQIAKENEEVPSVFGYTMFYVQTGSMEPTYNIGSVVIGKAVKDTASLSAGKEGVKDGDVVAFYDTKGKKITHRIESVIRLENGEIAYRTRGDSIYNGTDDEILTQDRIIAVIVGKII